LSCCSDCAITASCDDEAKWLSWTEQVGTPASATATAAAGGEVEGEDDSSGVELVKSKRAETAIGELGAFSAGDRAK
jgi:hypothetical protein